MFTIKNVKCDKKKGNNIRQNQKQTIVNSHNVYTSTVICWKLSVLYNWNKFTV